MSLRSWGLVPALVLALTAVPARAAVRAWLDANDVAPGDTIELTLEYDGQASGQPDLTPLARDFEVLDSSSSTSIEIVNGRTTERTRLTVSLSPKRAGRLTIPPLTWDGEQSPALLLRVDAASRGSAAQARPVFLETEVDPKQPYVQAAVRVTLRLYTRQALYGPRIAFDSTPGALVRQIGSDEQGSVERGGEAYEVLTRRYLLFPQRSGSLTVPGPVLSAQVPTGRGRTSAWGGDPFAGVFGSSPLLGGFIATARPVRVQGDPITLDVRPRPAAATGSDWLPAREVTLHGDWHPAALQAAVGDPVSVDLSLQAEGLTAAQLPDLSQLLALPPGLKSYPDAPKLSDTPRDDTILGMRNQSIAFIADQPGHFSLPALRVRWWDTRANEPREATLPARELVVLPATGMSANRLANVAPPPPEATAGQAGAAELRSRPGHARGPPWAWVSAALTAAWAATLAAWLRLRRRLASAAAPRPSAAEPRGPVVHSAARSRAGFRQACERHDAPAARRELLAWVRAAWPEPVPPGLNALARRVEDPHLAGWIRELDRACYAGADWHGEALAAALTELPLPRPESTDGGAAGPKIAPLYPQIDASRAGYV